jgi:hypothetical protein
MFISVPKGYMKRSLQAISSNWAFVLKTIDINITEIRRSFYIRFLVDRELSCPSLSWMVFESIIGCVLKKRNGNLMGSQSSPLDHWLSKSTTDTNKQENIAYKYSLPLKKITNYLKIEGQHKHGLYKSWLFVLLILVELLTVTV